MRDIVSRTDLTISIVTAANTQLVLDCLKSIFKTTKNLSLEVFVVINSPSAVVNCDAAIRDCYPEVNLIVNKEEKGFGQNHNMVIRRCKGKYILVLNDDTLILEDALDRMVDYMNGHPQVGILGCKILNPDGSLQWSCGRSISDFVQHFKYGVLRTLLSPLIRDQFFHETQEVNWVTGACLLVRSKAIREVGLFDENIPMYYEDGDWCYRMRLAGWKVVYYAGAEIIHYRCQTSIKHPAKTTIFYYQSRLYFFSKHYGFFVDQLVRGLTILDAIVRYTKTLIRNSSASQKLELLGAYVTVLKMVWSYRKAYHEETKL